MLHGGEIYNINQIIKYDFSVNLNPNPCPESVIKTLTEAVNGIDLYPDINQEAFCSAVAQAESCAGGGFSVLPENIIGGNGASELLCATINMLTPHKVLLPVPSFYGYRHALNMVKDCEICEYPLNAETDFEIRDDFITKITGDIDTVILTNPNNPTGKAIKEEMLNKIVHRCMETDTALIVDECFYRLSTDVVTARSYLRHYNRLFIIDAYTKSFAIPGVRLGYMICDADNKYRVKQMLPEWNLSVFAEKSGIACAKIITETDYLDKSVNFISEERVRLTDGLRREGIKVWESNANFLLIYCEDDLQHKLLERGILIRDCSNFSGLSKGYYRIAVKDRNSNDYLLDCL